MIRKGTAADLDGCEQVYNAHLDFEAANTNYTNWAKGLYPTRATAEKALAAGTLYVDEEDGVIVGCANLNHVQPKEYANIPWSIPAEVDMTMPVSSKRTTSSTPETVSRSRPVSSSRCALWDMVL